MATDYDPPTRYDLNEDLDGMSDATLKLLEREMGLKFSDIFSEIIKQPRPQLIDPLPKEEEKKERHQPKKERNQKTDEEKKAKKEKYVKVPKKRKGGKVELTEEEKQLKEKRLKEWEDGGNREEREARKQHELIEEKHNQDFVNYYKGLKILPESEWDAFYNKLKEPLDICFRINSVEKNYEKTKEEIDRQIADMLRH